MKNLSARMLITFSFLLLSTNLIMGQSNKSTGQTDHTTFSLSKTINLKMDSELSETIIQVSERKVGLILKISSWIMDGELTIEVYDPKGERQGNYSIDSQNSLKTRKIEQTGTQTKSQTVTGKISKTVEFPIIGNWVIKIIPKNATGSISIESEQISISK